MILIVFYLNIFLNVKTSLMINKKKERYAFIYNPLDTNLCKRACVIFGQACLM